MKSETFSAISKRLEDGVAIARDFDWLMELHPDTAAEVIRYWKKSRSQIHQDLFVLSELGFKRNGFFVEFGATNGLELSNSYLLEKEFHWSGILAEPAKGWHDDLFANRNVTIEKRCVWKDSTSSLIFQEADIRELSTIAGVGVQDKNFVARNDCKTYQVQTISLNDLLIEHNAPKVVDYLSIDTEGSEFDILSCFDFSQYRFRVITCEHNLTEQREKIYGLLTGAGYRRKFEKYSQFDDWYVSED